MADQRITTTRRVLMRALPFFPFIPATALATASDTTDPVLEALEIYAQARANHNLACEEYGRIEEEHREIRFYHPRVAVATQTTFGYGDFEDFTTEIYVHSEAEIARYYKGEKADRILASLRADQARHEADLERIGFTAAEKWSEDAARRLGEAESLVLTSVPTTDDGVVALATFAAKMADEDMTEDLGTAIRTIGSWLIARRRNSVEA